MVIKWNHKDKGFEWNEEKIFKIILVSLFALTLGVQSKTTYSTRLPNYLVIVITTISIVFFFTGLDVGKAD